MFPQSQIGLKSNGESSAANEESGWCCASCGISVGFSVVSKVHETARVSESESLLKLAKGNYSTVGTHPFQRSCIAKRKVAAKL
jgi:hypothetical protein